MHPAKPADRSSNLLRATINLFTSHGQLRVENRRGDAGAFADPATGGMALRAVRTIPEDSVGFWLSRLDSDLLTKRLEMNDHCDPERS